MKSNNTNACNRIMFAATGSGKGKTTIVSGLLSLLKEKGLDLHSFKCGPDYIDPKYHEAALGVPSTNLDPFFCDYDLLRASFIDAAGSFNVIEACMGLYDGLGTTSECSSYQVAQALQCPIILVVDASGMAYSLIAGIKGFLSMDESHLIKGVFLNRISSGFFEKIKPVIEKECGLDVVGYLPKSKDVELKSRHLGLMTVEENDGVEKSKAVGAILADTVDLDRLLEIAAADTYLPWDKKAEAAFPLSHYVKLFDSKKKIAVAYDEAFWFYYKDNIKYLELAGAQITYFSPLHDKGIPEDIDGIYIGGGYPENYLDQLEKNASMSSSVKEFAKNGGHIFAECGGFMYLCHGILDAAGQLHKMADIFDDVAENKGHLVRFGYVNVDFDGQAIKGHEFHHYDVSTPGDEALVTKASTGASYKAFRRYRNVLAGFPHLYFFSNPDFIIDFFDRKN